MHDVGKNLNIFSNVTGKIERCYNVYEKSELYEILRIPKYRPKKFE